jgi:hypothetical protein
MQGDGKNIFPTFFADYSTPEDVILDARIAARLAISDRDFIRLATHQDGVDAFPEVGRDGRRLITPQQPVHRVVGRARKLSRLLAQPKVSFRTGRPPRLRW